MVLAPHDFKYVYKQELRSLNSSHYCSTSFLVFLIESGGKHCQSGPMPRFQFHLGVSARFDGTAFPFQKFVHSSNRDSKNTVLNILHQVGKFLYHINTCKIRELLLEVLNHLCSRLREQIAKVTRVKSFSSNLIRTDTYKG